MAPSVRLWTRVLSTFTALSIAAACATARGPVGKTPVEVWCGGDDGLTRRLCEALEAQFGASPWFVLSNGKKPGTLLVTIPTHVRWTQGGGRTRLEYAVEFASADARPLGASSGACWEDELAKCAEAINKDAEGATRRFGR